MNETNRKPERRFKLRVLDENGVCIVRPCSGYSRNGRHPSGQKVDEAVGAAMSALCSRLSYSLLPCAWTLEGTRRAQHEAS